MRFTAALCLVVLLGASSAASAEDKPATPPSAGPSQVVMPDAEKIVLLLRSSLLTLNDALQTGNFTVLRDMGAPAFATPIPPRACRSPSQILPRRMSIFLP